MKQTDIECDHYSIKMNIKIKKEIRLYKKKKKIVHKIMGYKLKEEEYKLRNFVVKTGSILRRAKDNLHLEERWRRFKKNILDAVREVCEVIAVNNWTIKTCYWTKKLRRGSERTT